MEEITYYKIEFRAVQLYSEDLEMIEFDTSYERMGLLDIVVGGGYKISENEWEEDGQAPEVVFTNQDLYENSVVLKKSDGTYEIVIDVPDECYYEMGNSKFDYYLNEYLGENSENDAIDFLKTIKTISFNDILEEEVEEAEQQVDIWDVIDKKLDSSLSSYMKIYFTGKITKLELSDSKTIEITEKFNKEFLVIQSKLSDKYSLEDWDDERVESWFKNFFKSLEESI